MHGAAGPKSVKTVHVMAIDLLAELDVRIDPHAFIIRATYIP